jgi:hypothetical protein
MRDKNGVVWTVIAAGFCVMPSAVEACVINAVQVVDRNGKVRAESYDEMRRRVNHYKKIEVRENAKRAAWELAEGNVDVAAELASLLIPNVRSEDDGMRSSCGRMDGQDYAVKGDRAQLDKDFTRAIAGSPNRAKLESYYNERSNREYYYRVLGYPANECNAEFRTGFGAFLKQRHNPEEISEFWLFLKPRNRIVSANFIAPMREFMANTRKPPTSWDYMIGEVPRKQIGKWESRTAAGKALNASLNAFWLDQGPKLEDSMAICPKAMSAWRPGHDPEILKDVM